MTKKEREVAGLREKLDVLQSRLDEYRNSERSYEQFIVTMQKRVDDANKKLKEREKEAAQ